MERGQEEMISSKETFQARVWKEKGVGEKPDKLRDRDENGQAGIRLSVVKRLAGDLSSI